jgi:hypothetical protein
MRKNNAINLVKHDENQTFSSINTIPSTFFNKIENSYSTSNCIIK